MAYEVFGEARKNLGSGQPVRGYLGFGLGVSKRFLDAFLVGSCDLVAGMTSLADAFIHAPHRGVRKHCRGF